MRKKDKKHKKSHDKSSHHSSIERKNYKSSSHFIEQSSIIGKREKVEEIVNNTLISIEIPWSHLEKKNKSVKISENPEEP